MHKPVIPEAAQSPYPLQPLPRSADADYDAREAARRGSRWARTTLGAGAALGLASALAAAAFFFTRRSRRARTT